MLSVKAEYENGKLIIPEGSVKLPVGRKAVIITFLEEEAEELSDEFKVELDRRIEAIDNGDVNLIPGEEVFQRLRQKYS
jgi:putative addiction module component (TIGR02574 family)